MKTYLFCYVPSRAVVSVSTNDAEMEWPATGPDRKFTMHLMGKVLSPAAIHKVLFCESHALGLDITGALDIYLPPAYRPLPCKKSLWDRFTNLFKKENHHARNQHPERTQ
jgi:hypothetical protein